MRRILVSLLVVSLLMSLFLGFVSISFAQKKYNEAPMLAELVKAGKLPPVEQRLPKNPMVMPLYFQKQIGRYGGTLKLIQVLWRADLSFVMTERFVTADPMLSDNFIPEILESFDVSSDSRIFTFKIREGLKWSDGVAVTTEDVLFTWEDVLLNKQITPVFPPDLTVSGEVPALEIVDKYTFKIKFPKSYGTFIERLSMWHSAGDYSTLFLLPKHYLKQFHIKYTPQSELEKVLKEEGYGKDEWWKLFNRKVAGTRPWDNEPDIGAPGLYPWIAEKKLTPTMYSYVRNPYYYKVDPQGNQLPYIDRVYHDLLKETKLVLPKVIAGEVDYERGFLKFSDIPVLKQYAKNRGYRIMITTRDLGTWVQFFFNLTYDKDPVLAKIIHDERFRKAMSLAIDRKAISSSIFFGYAEPYQASLFPDSRYMVPGALEAYAKYDVRTANKLLDEMGLKRGPDGFRLRPDGKKLSIPLEYFEVNSYQAPVTEMVVKYWRNIGVEVVPKMITGSLWTQRNEANETVMTSWHQCSSTDPEFTGNAGGWFTIGAPTFYGNAVAPLWSRWFRTEGKEGKEPPKEIKEIVGWGEILRYSPNPKERVEAGKKLVQSQAEKVWRIGVCSAPFVAIINDKLRNVPEKGPDVHSCFVLFAAEQIFFSK